MDGISGKYPSTHPLPPRRSTFSPSTDPPSAPRAAPSGRPSRPAPALPYCSCARRPSASPPVPPCLRPRLRPLCLPCPRLCLCLRGAGARAACAQRALWRPVRPGLGKVLYQCRERAALRVWRGLRWKCRPTLCRRWRAHWGGRDGQRRNGGLAAFWRLTGENCGVGEVI
ncbi:hypothetical protein EDC01DRAFT_135021 [Geopyxis carbonaria]|nr:hypothetical protein EDC01DRAFT_135021 [Geopyxis carbonaria]